MEHTIDKERTRWPYRKATPRKNSKSQNWHICLTKSLLWAQYMELTSPHPLSPYFSKTLSSFLLLSCLLNILDESSYFAWASVVTFKARGSRNLTLICYGFDIKQENIHGLPKFSQNFTCPCMLIIILVKHKPSNDSRNFGGISCKFSKFSKPNSCKETKKSSEYNWVLWGPDLGFQIFLKTS